jgi:hypothetical protein
MLHEASHLARELGDKRCELDCFVALANLKLCEGDWLEARKVLPQCVDLLEQVESNKAVARCLEIFATINLEEGQPCDATRLWATADALRIRIGVPRPVNERASYEARLAKARLKLGEAAFAAAWEEGLSQSWQDALSL